ncbi:ABC transporter permease subunit [Helicobacter muridarum]|uniref:ABC transporter permease subunit n=1 Tax=Helicobacter muridarum TaxID=216 RepID=A0A099TY02_9HELI|nr:ABC transporter permease subunit [Helicobacter muridarum]TLE00147.1 ABC transporter permease subunit [Helicobacter muridarum]STQ87048.1 nickel transport system permease NikB [Helicobacter muridarum]
MFQYFLFRILSIIPILLVASFVIFALLRLSGTDPITQYLIHSNLPQTQELVESLRHEFGLDKPILQQYLMWLQQASRLDFGTSFITGRSVSNDFMYFLPNTFLLVGLSFLIILCVSIPLGILSSKYKDKIPDLIIRFFCFIGVCIPNFWLAFVLIIIFAIYLDWLPALGLDSPQSFILPCLSISLMSSCINTRLIRTNMLEIRKERHIVYAKLRALDSKKITLKHIFYNASLPIVTAFGMHIGELIGGALLIENIFAIPGIGLYSLQGIANHDYPIIQCFVVVLCLAFVVCNLLVDMLLIILDPRLRSEVMKSKQISDN